MHIESIPLTVGDYEQRLRDDVCPIVGGRRLIPREYVDVIAMELRRKGVLHFQKEQDREETETEASKKMPAGLPGRDGRTQQLPQS